MSVVLFVIVLLNVTLQWLVIGLIVKAVYGSRLELNWRTSFFGKTRCGLDIYLWDYSRSIVPNYGHSIFGLQWRNPRGVEDYPHIKTARRWAMPKFTECKVG